MEPIIDIKTNSLEFLLNKKPNMVYNLLPNDSITIKSRSFCVVEIKYFDMNDILEGTSNFNNNNQ